MQLSTTAMMYAGLALVAIVIGATQYEQMRRADKAKTRFFSVCEEEHDAEWCAQRAAEHHESCFAQNHKRETYARGAPATHVVLTERYHRCVMEGFPAWSAALAEKNREEREFVREVMN